MEMMLHVNPVSPIQSILILTDRHCAFGEEKFEIAISRVTRVRCEKA